MPWVLITLRRSPGQEILVLRLCSNLIRLYLFCVLVLWWLLKPKVVFNPPQTKLHCMSSQLNTMFGIAVTTTCFPHFFTATSGCQPSQQFTNQSLQPQLRRCQAMRGQTHTEQGLKIPNIKLMTHSGQIIPPAEKPPNRQHIQFFTPLPRC